MPPLHWKTPGQRPGSLKQKHVGKMWGPVARGYTHSALASRVVTDDDADVTA